MSNLSEIRDLAQGLRYVMLQTKNRELAKDSLDKLMELRNSAIAFQKLTSEDIVELIDNIIYEGQTHIGFRPSDAAEYIETHASSTGVMSVFVLYLLFLFIVSTYIFINSLTQDNRTFRKN